MYIDKFIAQSQGISLRQALQLITEGKVSVNGKICTKNLLYKPGLSICIEDQVLTPVDQKEKVYLAFNKPIGIVCTEDRLEPNNIKDFLGLKERVFTVGRLDKDSEGLILLTNDGDIANRIIHSENAHEKEYLVTLNKALTSSLKISQLEAGIRLKDEVTRPCIVIPQSDTVFKFILTQGLNRQIRRMTEAIGYEVIHLKRTRVMNIELADLEIGKYRNLTEQEKVQLLASLK